MSVWSLSIRLHRSLSVASVNLCPARNPGHVFSWASISWHFTPTLTCSKMQERTAAGQIAEHPIGCKARIASPLCMGGSCKGSHPGSLRPGQQAANGNCWAMDFCLSGTLRGLARPNERHHRLDNFLGRVLIEQISLHFSRHPGGASTRPRAILVPTSILIPCWSRAMLDPWRGQ